MIVKSEGASSSSREQWSRSGNNLGPGSAHVTLNDLNRIQYEYGPPHNADGSARWKGCIHDWKLGNAGVVTVREENKNSRKYDDYVHLLPAGVQILQSRYLSEWRNNPLPSESSIMGACENTMSGRLETTALPITDLVQMSNSVAGNRNLVGDLVGAFTDLFSRKPKSLGDLLKKVASAHLAWNFGIVPLVQTLLSLIYATERVDKHLAKLRAINESDQLNFTVTMTPFDASRIISENATYAYSSQSNAQVRCRQTLRTRTIVKAHFRTSVRYDTSDALRTRLLWDACGVTSIVGTVWDLLPWSFVVDWFVSVSDFCDQLDSYYFRAVPLERMGELRDVWYTATRSTQLVSDQFRATNAGISWRRVSLRGKPEECYISSGQFVRSPINNAVLRTFLTDLSVKGTSLTTSQKVTGLELLLQRAL